MASLVEWQGSLLPMDEARDLHALFAEEHRAARESKDYAAADAAFANACLLFDATQAAYRAA